MFGVTTSDDYQPVTWVGRHPVHVTTLLVAVHVFLMVVACFSRRSGPPASLAFSSSIAPRSWGRASLADRDLRLCPCAYSGMALLWFAVEMYMLFVFGREVERFIGRRAFIVLYALLLWVPTLFSHHCGALDTARRWPAPPRLHFGIFIAFATIYPNVEMLLRIQAKWVALILVAIGTLAALANHDWASLIVLWVTIATASAFIWLRGVGPELDWWSGLKSRLQPKPKFHGGAALRAAPRQSSRRTSTNPSTRCWIRFPNKESTA